MTSVPRPVWLPWLPLVLGAVGVVYGMIGFWVRGYDNYDRACILLASAYLVHLRQAKLLTLPDTPRPTLGIILVVIGAIAYLPPWFVYTQIGPRPVILWWETLALLVATAGMILVRSGPRLLYEVRFMLIFPLFALPLPGRILIPFNEIMQSISADLGAAILPWTGVPVAQKIGNHIMLRNGQGIEVAEMCSGVVMIRTTLSLAALLSHLYGFGIFRSAILLGLTLPIIIFVNALRVTAFGYLQDSGLSDWVQPGWKHELVGYLAYIPGLCVVIAVVSKLKPKTEPEVVSTVAPPIPSQRSTLAAAATLTVASVAALLAMTAPGVGVSVGGDLSFNDFPAKLGKWDMMTDDGDPEPLKELRARQMDGIRATLTTNAEMNRNYYTFSGGDRINLWLFYWQSSMVVKDYHHPDVCNNLQGFATTHSETIPILTPAGRRIPVTYREINRDGVFALVVYYTQEGRRLWTDDDERKARSFLFPLIWTKERLERGQRDGESDDRLQVYLSLELMKGRSKDVQRASILELAGLAADELYKRCPWADPGIAGK